MFVLKLNGNSCINICRRAYKALAEILARGKDLQRVWPNVATQWWKEPSSLQSFPNAQLSISAPLTGVKNPVLAVVFELQLPSPLGIRCLVAPETHFHLFRRWKTYGVMWRRYLMWR